MTIVDANEITPRTVRLYGASELGVISLLAQADENPRVHHLGGELFAGLDAPHGATSERESAPWNPTFDQVLDAVAQGALTLPAAADGVIRVDDEAQAIAALLDPKRIPRDGLAGTPVVFALARTRVLIAGADDEAAFARILDAAEELYDTGAPLVSAHPIVLADGAWDTFGGLAALPALAVRMQRVLRLYGVRAYEQQGDVLREDETVHVADPKAHVREDGVTVTFAAWPKGTATLLPVVDNVMVAETSGKLGAVTFDDFLDAAGDRVTRTGLAPERYFVPGDPPRASAQPRG